MKIKNKDVERNLNRSKNSQGSLRFTAESSDRGNSTKRRNLLAEIKRRPNDRLGLSNQGFKSPNSISKRNNDSRTHFIFLERFFSPTVLCACLLSTAVIKDPFFIFFKCNVTDAFY